MAWSDMHRYPLNDIELTSVGSVPLHLMTTGFRSVVGAGAVIEARGGPASHVGFVLDAGARDPSWTERKRRTNDPGSIKCSDAPLACGEGEGSASWAALISRQSEIG